MRTTFDMMRVWAALTGLSLVLVYFVAVWLGVEVPQALPMLATAIGGFELFLFSQDMWLRRRSRHG